MRNPNICTCQPGQNTPCLTSLCCKALWRGNSAALLRLVPEVGIMFMLNEQLQTMFSPVDGSPPGIWSHVAAGDTLMCTILTVHMRTLCFIII